jgi:hypothetical protein
MANAEANAMAKAEQDLREALGHLNEEDDPKPLPWVNGR